MENDPLYEQGLKHLGAGEWGQAVDCFTKLQSAWPQDPRPAQFLETVRLRAAMSPGLEKSSQLQARSARLRTLTRVGAVLIALAVIAGIYMAYQTWAVPAQAERSRLTGLEKLRQTAQGQVASGKYTDAIKTYQNILNQAPNDPNALAGLARAQPLEKASNLYDQAQAELNAGDYVKALQTLQEINSIEPNYRGVTALIEQVKGTNEMSQSYEDAVHAYEAKNWADAIQTLESIRSSNPAFKTKEVKDYLFDAYAQFGEQQIASADSIARVEQAESYYEKALQIRPLDQKADLGRRAASAFLDGARAYQAKDWETVIQKLSAVYDYQADYFHGQAAAWLYEAYMATGETFMALNNPFSARDRFAQAVKLAPSSELKSKAQERFNFADGLTTPTPTVPPTIAPRATATPLPSGYVAPYWTRGVAATPDPYYFVLVNTTYLPNTITGHACQWSGITGRIFDMKGAPLTAATLGVKVSGPEEVGVAAGSATVIGPSGWLVQWDVVPKEVKGVIQVFYHDKPASAQIPFVTRGTCYENILIMDIQQSKPLPQ